MKIFNPLHYPICFSPVHRLSPSTWTGHIPFAMFLTDILKPTIIVELGTFYGTSYCAFCQAVQELSLETRCYAVDTWEGDPQSGFYGTEILDDLKHYHDPLYGDFSRLIQSTFDESIEHFTDKTIDLLHIDGFHTYREVKKDFERWLPKVSEWGVVLFHDINVREKDFGVWKFWEEIRLEYPHFEFTHSHGLGVLAVGDKCSSEFKDFLEFSNNNPVQIRNFFHQLGQRFENFQELKLLGEVREKLEIKEKQFTQLEHQFNENEKNYIEAVHLQRELETKNKQLENETRKMREKAAEIRHTEEVLSNFDQEHINKSQNLYGKEWELQPALANLNNLPSSNGKHLLNAKDAENEKQDKQKSKLILGVVTYNNSKEQISQLLKSIELSVERLKNMPVETEIFVVDNGQESFSGESGNVPIVRFESEGNVGFGNAMNKLMSAAFADSNDGAAEWFLCVNPDGTLHRDALKELVVMGGENPNSLIEARQFPEEHNKEYDAETFETPWASGACLLISRSIFRKVGGFDPNIFMYLEDVDFSWRVRASGFSIKIAPRAIFGHSVLGREFSEFADKNMLLSGRYLASKWQNSKFVKWTESELVARRYFPSVEEMPELPDFKKHKHIKPKISDFSHYFSFSKPRW